MLQALADVELIGPGKCQFERARADVESSGLFLSRAILSRCRVEMAWANIESSKLGLMSSRLSRIDVEPNKPCQCRAEQPRADVKPSGPESMSSHQGPYKC